MRIFGLFACAAVMLITSAVSAEDAGVGLRVAYIQAEKPKIQAIVDEGGKAHTAAEHDLIKAHWLTAVRLLRIKEIALEEKDPKTAARADALLAKVDARFHAKLHELAQKAPPKGTAP